ncbi:Serine/threonine kinase [Pestalotiopsis sp. IQ-011]
MPPTRMSRPILGASSRLFRVQGQSANAIAPASTLAAAAVAAFRRSQSPKQSSICLSCSFHTSRRVGSSSSRPPPPEPPNFDHLKPEDKSSSSHPNFDHLRPVESKPEPEAPVFSKPLDNVETKATSSSSPESTSSTDKPKTSDKDDAGNPTLPSHTESRRSDISAAFNTFMDRAQSQLFLASQRINDLTGYSGIETLKNQIAGLEASLAAAQEALHEARREYKTAVADRAATQREVTTLLARQKTWTPADFERFTALYRTDYEVEAGVAERARELEHAEREAERLARELSSGILARYHEEQIWSDKIRRMSTWGTWGLMGVNILLFFMFQFGAEPWRRARLVRGFEEKVREALEHERETGRAERLEFFQSARLENAAAAAAQSSAPEVFPETPAGEAAGVPTEAPVVAAVEAVETPPEVIQEAGLRQPTSWREIFTSTAWWRETAAELTSERKVAVRMCDVSLLALEGAAAGAALAGTVALFFLRRA